MKDIQRIRHDDNRIKVTIARSGQGKSTRYKVLQSGVQCTEQGEDEPGSEIKGGVGTLRLVNKYTVGRYGHLVRH